MTEFETEEERIEGAIEYEIEFLKVIVNLERFEESELIYCKM